MKILINLDHPAHVHLFKNMIWNLEKKGHKVKITARDKEVVLDLLNAYGFEYENTGKHQMGLFNKVHEMIKINHKLYKIAKKFGVNILVSAGSPYAAHVSRLLNKPHIAFDDTEHSREQYRLYSPFTDTICTPSCFKNDLGKKQVRYNGYHELAYLHPNYFKPDPRVLRDLNLTEKDKFIILRFVSWGASHDVGEHGLGKNIKQLIKKIEDYGSVFITSETELTNNFGRYRITTSPEQIHSLLYFAEMYIGEGATMATESGILGTPSIYISSLAKTMGNFDELQNKYGLVYSFTDPNKALEKAIELLEDKNLKSEWQKKREKLLKEKIDVTKWMTNFIENYPESFMMDLSS